MRKIFLLITFIVMALCTEHASAQLSSPSMTYFKPFSVDNKTEHVDFYIGQGGRFVGTKHTGITNGQVTSVTYFGSAIFPDGGRIITGKAGYGFNENLQPYNGTFYEIEPDGSVTRVEMSNGRQVSSSPVYRQYVIEDNCIVFPKTQAELEAEAASYGYGSYSGGNSYSTPSSSGSNYNSHSATCMGCHGSGRCDYCGGTGQKYVNNHYIKCGRCHGTGTCQSCAGVGKKYGNY